jgi:RNA polymerase sigma factor (sigma-70 family)
MRFSGDEMVTTVGTSASVRNGRSRSPHSNRNEAVSTTDAELLHRFVCGRDEEAFSALVLRHGPLVHGVCRRLLHSAVDAEDAFQATFLVLACNAERIRTRESVGSWLFGVASRVARKMRCQAVSRRRREQREANAARAASAQEAASWRETCVALHEELSRLPEKLRAPLLLCYWQGLTQDEAAHQLGIPRGTLKRRLETGRQRLGAQLARRGLMLSALLLASALGQGQAWAAAVQTDLVRATARKATRAAAARIAQAGLSPAAALTAASVLRGGLALKLKAAMACVIAGGCALLIFADPFGATGSETLVPGVQAAPTAPSRQIPATHDFGGPEDSAPGDIHLQEKPLNTSRQPRIM